MKSFHRFKAVLLSRQFTWVVILGFAVLGSAMTFPLGQRTQTVAPGVTYYVHKTVTGKKLIAHVLKVNLKEKKIAIRSLKARGKETLGEMVSRLNGEGEKVVGAINGDFFSRSSEAGIPLGVQVSDGKLIFGPKRRTMIGFGTDNRPHMGVVGFKGAVTLGSRKKITFNLDGVNILPKDFKKDDGIILYTPAFLKVQPDRAASLLISLEKITPALRVGNKCVGKVADVSYGSGNLDVPEDGCLITFIGAPARQFKNSIKKGLSVSLILTLPPVKGGVPQAISGGPRLLRRGRLSVEFNKEDFTREQSIYLNRKRHPRSAVGFDRLKKYLYLVMVEGRHPASQGVSMGELGELMRELGCYEAMSFDGGGSAALYVGNKGIVSYVDSLGSPPERRAIANSLLITHGGKFKPESIVSNDNEPNVPKETEPKKVPEVTKGDTDKEEKETKKTESKEDELEKLEKELEKELEKLDDLD